MKVWIISPLEEHLIKVPSLRALVVYLNNDKHFDVTLFCGCESKSKSNIQEVLSVDVNIIPLYNGNEKGLLRLMRAVFVWSNILILNLVYNKPEIVIAVDKWGIFLSSLLLFLFKVPIIYLNFELRVQQETKKTTRKIVNYCEGFIHRKAFATIIQDVWRADFIKKEHSLSCDHIFKTLPNSPEGTAVYKKNNFLRSLYKINDNKVVLLYVGSIVDHFMIAELLDAFIGQKNAVLVIHSIAPKNTFQYREEIKAKIQTIDSVILSESLFTPSILEEMISSADIGFGMFKPVIGNYMNEVLMGHSGGKILLYLKSGIPVVTSKFPSTAWVEIARCGKSVEKINRDSLADIIEIMRSQKKEYSDNAIKYFNAELCLDTYLKEISSFIKNTYCGK